MSIADQIREAMATEKPKVEEERQPPIGSLDGMLLKKRLLRDGKPKDHPFLQGVTAYGVADIDEDDDPIGNPYKEGSSDHDYWYSGYHTERRNLGDRLEEDTT